jgi:hypothetical protein
VERLAGLAQHRRRFLLVARLKKSVPCFIYQPPKKRVRGCGEVLGALPLPEDESAGELHKLPKLSWLNWVRLALIPAGGDWERPTQARGPPHSTRPPKTPIPLQGARVFLGCSTGRSPPPR